MCQFPEVRCIFKHQAAAAESSRDERCERGHGGKEAAAAVQEFCTCWFYPNFHGLGSCRSGRQVCQMAAVCTVFINHQHHES